MSLRSKIAVSALLHQINLRLDVLRGCDDDALRALDEHSTDHVRFGDEIAELITYRVIRTDGSTDIVVQAYPPQSSGLIQRNVRADGFRILPTGERRPLTETELYEFM